MISSNDRWICLAKSKESAIYLQRFFFEKTCNEIFCFGWNVLKSFFIKIPTAILDQIQSFLDGTAIKGRDTTQPEK